MSSEHRQEENIARFAASACLMALLACSATAELRPYPEVTVILNFKGTHSSGATREMQTEATSILKEAGVNLSWRALLPEQITIHTTNSL